MVREAKQTIAEQYDQMILADYFAWTVAFLTLALLAVMYLKINSLMSKAVAF